MNFNILESNPRLEKDSNLILIIGMYRSGTVWCFNLIKTMLETVYGAENVYARYRTDWVESEASGKKHLLMKFHEYDDRLVKRSNFTVFSERDYNSMISSMNRMHEVDKNTDIETLDYMHPSFKKRVLSDSVKYRNVANYTFNYDNLLNDKLVIASSLASKMNILTGKMNESNKINYEQLVKILREVESIPNSSHLKDTGSRDINTLMHKNHKSDKFNI